jgi:hypothetical protein
MAAKLEKTSVPGIFRRHRKDCARVGRCECPYVIVYRAHGRQHTETHRTLAEAREAKRTSESAVASGEYQERARRDAARLRPRVGGALSRHRPTRVPRGDP